MANRGACYGIAAAVQCKLANKRDQELEQEILAWMSEILGERLPQGEFGEILRDGVILCKLMNRLKPGMIPKINASGAPFKMMENIENFIKAAERYGVPKIDLFQTVDLWEKRNIPSVVQCIMAVGRCGYLHPDFQGPFLGPRPSEDYRREFNEQMLGTSF